MKENQETTDFSNPKTLFRARLQDALTNSFLTFQGFAVSREKTAFIVLCQDSGYKVFLENDYLTDISHYTGGGYVTHTSIKMSADEFNSMIDNSLANVKANILQQGLIPRR
jgi:hypothetical protein